MSRRRTTFVGVVLFMLAMSWLSTVIVMGASRNNNIKPEPVPETVASLPEICDDVWDDELEWQTCMGVEPK